MTPRGISLFCSDLDGTLLGDAKSARRFADVWESVPGRERPLLVFNSGRDVADIRELVGRRSLPAADYLIGSLGTEIHNVAAERAEPEFSERFGTGWNFSEIERIMEAVPQAERQPAASFRPFKASWFLRAAGPDVLAGLRARLHEAGLEVSVIYSSGLHLDIVPRLAGKGRSLAWLCLKLGIPLESALVAGDSGNDAEMFALPGVRRLIVGNAQMELFRASTGLPAFVARAAMADGVLEGLNHFGVIEKLRG